MKRGRKKSVAKLYAKMVVLGANIQKYSKRKKENKKKGEFEP